MEDIGCLLNGFNEVGLIVKDSRALTNLLGVYPL